MDTTSSDFCIDSEWQATSLGFFMNLRNVLMAVSENSTNMCPQVPKPLTSGAVYMIYLILAFVLLAVAGSAVTVLEFVLNCFVRKAKDEESKKSPESSTDKSWLHKCKIFLSCFCVLNNTSKLLSVAPKKDQFECLNGIRFLSNVWIILLHIVLGYISYIRNVDALQPLMGMWSSQFVMNGQFAVDAFFVLSGFLNAYLFFNNYDKSNGNVSWFYFYFKRFVRLTPVYMIVLGFYTFLFPYMGGDIIRPTFDTNPVCRQNWWWNLLYINNFTPFTKQCMEWCWYLAADMQFYIVSPIFLIALLRTPRFGYILTSACIVASCLASFTITQRYNLIDGYSRMEYHFDDLEHFFIRYYTYFDIVYTKPHTRICSYLVGILKAHQLYDQNLKSKISKSKKTGIFGWIAVAVLWFIAYFALFKREESIVENAVYNGIKHLFYSYGLSRIIFACLTEQGGFVNKCLSWKVFAPLAKLSYCAYLIHPLILVRYFQAATYLEDLGVSSVLPLAGYVYFWTYVLSFITSLLFEMPFLNLLDLRSTKKQPANVEHSSSYKDLSRKKQKRFYRP